jgi:hypothetical protein
MPDKIYNLPLPPWRVTIGNAHHLVISGIRHHHKPQVIFTEAAAAYCGGITERDEDGSICGVVNDDYAMIYAARLIVESEQGQGRENLNV